MLSVTGVYLRDISNTFSSCFAHEYELIEHLLFLLIDVSAFGKNFKTSIVSD